MQEGFGGKAYYNPDILVDGVRIKYGVVNLADLLGDLNEWNSMYLAGRMHKPILVLRDDARVRLASTVNLSNALRIALLLLPERFSGEDLFLTIAGLSYRGDFRMSLGGENPHKVFNIVYAQMDAFQTKYRCVIEDSPNISYLADSSLQQDMSERLRVALVRNLPPRVQDLLMYHYKWYLSRHHTGSQIPTADLVAMMVDSPGLEDCVGKTLKDIVAVPAINQSLKGLLSAGVGGSLKYVLEKMSKSIAAKK